SSLLCREPSITVGPARGSRTMDYAVPKRRPIDLPRILFVTVMVCLYLTFAWGAFLQWQKTGRPDGLGLMIEQALVAVLFIVNRRPLGTSRSLVAWIATGIGTFGINAVRPHYAPVAGLGALYTTLQLAGVGWSIISLGWLGRSFGLVAANRGVKVDGPYRFVRHPIYAGYVVIYVAFLLEDPLPWDLLVFLVVMSVSAIRVA